jgi:hypothetical protein
MFDKVVVDSSVIKFFAFPWDTLIPLLKKGKESTLIATGKGTHGIQ